MMKVILLISLPFSLFAEINHPADISFMVADLKYSQENGVKICEIQHGFNSALDEDTYLHGFLGTISPRVASFFSNYKMKKWASGIVFSPLALALSSRGWTINKSTRTLFNDSEFLALAKTPPTDPTSIASYSAIHYCSQRLVGNEIELCRNYPGILFVDAGTIFYWCDKYKMTLLFKDHPELKKLKPEWGLYECEYKEDLAAKIEAEIPADLYVLKPRNEMQGNGVIIVGKKDLDMTLRNCFGDGEILQRHPDAVYAYWEKSKQTTFIVEKYYPSDPLILPKISSKKGSNEREEHDVVTYDPTMRVAFLLIFDKGVITCKCLGGYWRIPRKSLEEGGSLNETRKDYNSIYHSAKASAEVLYEVFRVMEQSIPLLYRAILERKLQKSALIRG